MLGGLINQDHHTIDKTNMTKTGIKYLRYYLIETVNIVKNNVSEYKVYCSKSSEKQLPTSINVFAPASRKLVRLINELHTKIQIYSRNKVEDTQ